MIFDGEWAACESCHQFIEADERQALLDHAEECFHLREPPPHPEARLTIQKIHDLFFANRVNKAALRTEAPVAHH